MQKALRIDDLRTAARRALPRPIFDYIDGGAEDELAMRRSVSAFDGLQLAPQALVDVGRIDTATRLLGRTIAYPLMLSPTGLTGLFHRHGEPAVAAAASALGLPYCLSTLGTTNIESFAKAQTAPKLLQLYIFKDRGLTDELIQRAAATGYDGLVLTIDTVIAGKRLRDMRNGLIVPPRLTARGFLGFALRPSWSIPALFGKRFEFANLAHRSESLRGKSSSLQDYVNSQFDRSLTWRDVEWLAARWRGPLAIKGIMRADDARHAVESGATAIMVSNHGGRQLDAAPAPIECIAPVADQVAGKADIICDGGIRRGSDIVKALALGATACSVGRPYLFGLAAAGAEGVRRALDILVTEMESTMILMGAPDISAVRSAAIKREAPLRRDGDIA